MKFTNATVSAFLLSVGGVAAFSQNKPSTAFLARSSTTASTVTTITGHSIVCGCPSCRAAMHPVGCRCATCNKFALCSTAVDEEASTATEPDDIPAEVEALDGINSEEEAHNAERPARKSLKTKKSKGKSLSEFSVGDTVTAKTKTITSYGAFMDIGAETDGLLHISNLSTDFVSNVKDVLQEGKEYEVRIISIDEGKNQVGLSLLTQAQEESAQQQQRAPRSERQPRSSARKDDSAIIAKLQEIGWDETKFVEGTVVNTVDFGAFVSVDCSQFNEEIEGTLDGLVHISALANKRVSSVSDVVKTDDKVQVRLKSIDNSKVSLTMVSAEDEKSKVESRGGMSSDSGPVGNTEWKASLKELQANMPEFKNNPLVIDNRND